MADYQVNIENKVVVTGEKEIDRLSRELISTKEQLDRVNSTLQTTRFQLSQVQDEFNNFSRGNGIDILQAELDRFRNTASTATEEFRSFLSSVNLNDAWGDNDRMFDSLFKEIEQGSKTASQAILEVKTQYRALMEENYNNSGGLFDTQTVQQFTTTLEQLSNTMNLVLEKVTTFEREGVKAVGDVGTTSGGVANILKQIETATAGMSAEAKNAYEPITKLLGAMTQYASLDDTKLLGVSQAFRNIADIGTGSYGTKSIENIVYLAQQLQTISANGTNSIRFDFTGLNELHVSGAALKNLAEFLPQLDKVSAKKLDNLGKVDLSNFGNIKASKAALSNLATYLPAIEKVSAAKLKKLEEVNLSNFNNVVVNKSSIEAISRLTEALNVLKETTTSVSSSKDSIGIGMDAAAIQQLSTVSGALKEISTINSSITSSYKSLSSALSGNESTAQNVQDLETLRAKYTELQTAIEQLRLSKASASQEDINRVHVLQTETQSFISSIQERITAEKEAAAVAQQTSKEEADTAKRAAESKKASTKQQINDENAKRAAIKQYYNTLTQIETAIKNYTAAENSHKGSSKEAYAALVSQRDALKRLNGEVTNGSIKTDALKAATSKANETLKSSTATIKANGDATKTWSERIGNLGAKFGTWFSITRVIMYVVRAIRQMISASIELDSAMAQMQIVTKSSESQINAFADSAAKAAQRIGSRITDFISSATTFARLGYSMDESGQLAEFTAMLQNVGDIDVSEAQDAITSIVKAFNVDTNQIESVMDKLVTTGNNFPISVSQIAEGMTNASSALAAAGNSFEQSVALLTAANTTINLCRAA